MFNFITTEELKIKNIKEAIENAEKMQSKLKPENFDVPALASLKIRHLLNNLGRLGSNYLECGPHKGGSFTSTISYNPNLKFVTAIDNFESDITSGETAMPQFIENVHKFKPENSVFNLIRSDCFLVNIHDIPNGVDLYLYDAGHSFEEQKNALLYYKKVLAEEFIYICDDWTFERVKEGTIEGIKDGGYEIVYERELLNTTPGSGHLNDEWWRGYYVALLRKK